MSRNAIQRFAYPLLLACGAAHAQVEMLGMRNSAPLGVGGRPADIPTVSAAAAVLREGYAFPDGFLCSGSVIADGWVLTAAHCTFDEKCADRDYDTLYVIVGKSLLVGTKDRAAVKDVYKPASFKCMPLAEQRKALKEGRALPMGDDIALLEVPAAKKPQSLFVRAQAMTFGPDVVASGWGATGATVSLSSSLVSVDLTMLPRDDCVRAWAPSVPTSDQLCIGPPKSNPVRGICSGDSGGPLSVNSLGNRVQVGVVSFGHLKCEVVDRPSLFTDLGPHRDWIEKIVGKANVPTPPTLKLQTPCEKLGTC